MINNRSVSKSDTQHKGMSEKIHALKSRHGEGGFTLVEVGVVLIIIGILLGGVLYAEELYQIVRVRRVMSDINGLSAATKGFQDKYGSVPGDFPLATRRVPNCNAGMNCVDGDGSGFVGVAFAADSGWAVDQAGTAVMPQVETTMFWKHLALAHFIKGINPAAPVVPAVFGETHPETSVGGGFNVFVDTRTAGSTISVRIQNAPRYSNRNEAIDPATTRPFTVKNARYMDQKYDDGRASAGNMWGIPFAGRGGDPACRKSWSGSNGENYNFDPADRAADVSACQFHFIFH